jgi:hypothetical protein
MSEEESIVRMSFDAFVRKDRTLMESLLSDDFHFTSPYDDHIDKEEFFERCWPGADQIESIEILSIGVTDSEVLCHYEVRMKDGTRANNMNSFIIRDDMIVEQESFFGDPPPGMSRDSFSEFNLEP